MVSGHNFAKGGHVGNFAKSKPVSAAPANKDTVNGLTAREPDMEGNAAAKRKVPSTVVDEEKGGKGELTGGYKAGGKVVHVHQHYHNGKRLPSKRKMDAARRKAEGGLISSGTAGVKLGKNPSSPGKGTPSIRSKFQTGGTINPVATGGTINPVATGGTINPMNAGGALYAKGGDVKGALRKHVDTPAPQGHKGLGAMIRRGG